MNNPRCGVKAILVVSILVVGVEGERARGSEVVASPAQFHIEYVESCGRIADSIATVGPAVTAFENAPGPETAGALATNLAAKAARWESYPDGGVSDVIGSIEEIAYFDGALDSALRNLLHAAARHPGGSFVGNAAAYALAELAGRGAVPALLDAMHSDDPETVRSAALALSLTGDPAVVRLLEGWLGSASATPRASALQALVTLCPETTRDAAEAAVHHPDASVRRSAYSWFASCGGVDDAPLLVCGLAEQDRSGYVPYLALRGLLRLGSHLGCSHAAGLLASARWDTQVAAARYLSFCEGTEFRIPPP